MNHRHIMLKISKKEINAPGFATLFFDYAINFKPGQFIMVWIPGVDEKPYTISFHSGKQFGITIEAKGIFSKKAISMEAGDIIGIRGPFGNGFTIISSSSYTIAPLKTAAASSKIAASSNKVVASSNKVAASSNIAGSSKVAVVAGGCGMAPLATLIEKIQCDCFFVHGARTKEFILYPDRFRIKRHICTDDGSLGHKGFVTDLLQKKIEIMEKISGKPFDMVYACGPEIMMYRVFQICEAHKIPCEVSLERYMRCGFGLCGACVCGSEVVCRDGPVFGSNALRTMADFNRTALLKSGKAVDLNQYVSWRCK